MQLALSLLYRFLGGAEEGLGKGLELRTGE